MGKTIKKWIFRIVKIGCGLLALGILLVLGWLWSQPAIPSSRLPLQDEYLADALWREVADNSTEDLLGIAQETGVPSLSVAISVDGNLCWAAAFGFSDLAEQTKADRDTLYRTGSVAKSITGFAAAKMEREGKLDLDANVRAYLPDFPDKEWEITLRELGSHTGGIRHYAPPGADAFYDEQFSQHHYASVQESLKLFANEPLAYEPGTQFTYSTHGFTLLSAAMEAAYQMSFPEYLSQLVLEPLDMRNTSLDDVTNKSAKRAIPYVSIAGRAIHAEGPDPSYKWAGGGLLSTPSDLVKLGDAMLAEQFVTTTDRLDCFTPRPLDDGSENPQRYALGWRNGEETDLLESDRPVAVLNHGGASPGGSSFLLVIPDGRVVAAVMTNVSISESWPLREKLYHVAGRFRNLALQHEPSATQSVPGESSNKPQ